MSDEKKVRERFTQDLETARKFMEPLHQKMDKYYEMYRNRWGDEDVNFRISDLYAYVETVVPILTNNRTRASVKAEYPDYVKHAEGMSYILDYVFDTNNWDYKAQRIARMAEIYRSALVYTGYDPKANNGTGKLTIVEINPRWCYLDPAATELEDSSFFIYAEPMRASKVKQMYPEKAKEIGRNKDDSFLTRDNKTGGWFKQWFKSITSAFSFGSGTMTRYGDVTTPELDEQEKRKNAVAFIHYWYRDDNDKWRVAYFADDVFLEDMENPFWHERLPFDIYSPTEDILSALGIPMAEHIERLNWEKNVLLDTITKHAKKTVNPPRMYNISYLGNVNPSTIKGEDDDLIPVPNPDFAPLNSLVADLFPAPMPAFVDSLPERYAHIADVITGVNDSFRGLSEATSGKEVQLKQEAAYTRIKTKVDNFEKFVKSMAEKIIINAMQFLNTTTTFRVKGDYRRFQDMINSDNTPFQVEPIPVGQNEQGQMEYDKREFFLYANPNEWTRIEGEQDGEGQEQAQKAYRILQLTVEIEAGSSLPTSRMARREEALELYDRGAIDQQALLEAFDYPQYEEIIKRMQEAAAAQQQAQAQAEMAKQQQQMQMEQMRMEQQMMMKQMDHESKMQQARVKQSAKQVEQPQQQAALNLASEIDKLKQMVPELQNMSDDEIVQLLANMNQAG